MTMYLIAQGVGKLAKFGKSYFQPKFGKTKTGQRLSKYARHGYLSEGQEGNLISKAGATAGELGKRTLTDVQGMQIKSGMGTDSIAGQRAYLEQQAHKDRTVTDYAKDIYQKEEMAKKVSADAFAKGTDIVDEQKRKAKWDLLSDTADLASSAIGSPGTPGMPTEAGKVAEGADLKKQIMEKITSGELTPEQAKEMYPNLF